MLLDKDIREPLFEFLEDCYGTTRIIEEKRMGKSRADVIMVTPAALYGIEIKSDADTYARLSGQVKDYDKYCDYNIVVVGTKHALHIREHVPEHWGVITVEDGDVPDFYMLRRPCSNPNMQIEKKMEILWRTELARIQEEYNLPKYKDKSKEYAIERICTRIPGKITVEQMNQAICRELLERDYTTIAEELQEYRKSESRKRIEAEQDPQKKLELMVDAAGKGNTANLRCRKRRGKR